MPGSRRHWCCCWNIRLDWNALSSAYTGDGPSDANTVKFSKDVDLFVTELQPDPMNGQDREDYARYEYFAV
jgi:hypothetical protein